ncbi:ABC transporter permease [Fulvivirga lutea]|uniref:ABC transporter permease n=1 Tax=Fulvivirga lutea TaxID=2810512 RepID=A0A975A094_9BACT|nr:ABC transporter permease [Fulvivirga lutea]QSE96566.1 ABC transporter permease [Fulvivirga lutea]
MITNYIKIAIRNLLNKKVFSFINIAGLALGMAACLSIYYYVNYEFSYNQNFSNSSTIYRTYFTRQMEDGENRVYFNAGTALKNKLDEIPEIEGAFRLVKIDYQNNSLIYDSDAGRVALAQQGVQFADKSIKNVLDLELVSGSFAKMDQPMKVVLSESVAAKFFDPQQAIGKTITLSGNIGNHDYEIVGVTKDLPTNTTFNLSVLLSMPSKGSIEGAEQLDNWNSWNAETYILSDNSINKIQNALKRNVTDLDIFHNDETIWSLDMLPLTDLHLTTVTQEATLDKSAEKLLLGLQLIGLFILTIAWINFINLSTARAIERAREVGVRKALGSHLYQIRLQFMVESFIINCLAAAIALTITQLCLPALFGSKDLMALSEDSSMFFWTTFTSVLVLGSFLSGLYPAFVLSGFKPTVVLKGKITSFKSGELLRKGLVIFQFAASSIMIIGTYVVYEQITYMKNKDLGLNINNILILDAPPTDVTSSSTDRYQVINSFKEEINQLNAIKHITASSDIPGQDTGWATSLRLSNETDDDKKNISLLACDRNFVDAYDIEMAAGRFYNLGDGTFDKGHFVINEAALSLLGFETAEEAIGKNLIEGRMFPELTIVGVVKDFHQQSLKSKIEPMALVYSSWSNYYSLALNIDESLSSERKAVLLKESLDQIEAIWVKFFPEYPFDYNFLDSRFNEQYKSDQEFSFIISLFALLSVIIAGLGLLGLASYAVVQRTKEIGIRKVLGASSGRIIQLLTMQYLWLILVGIVVAIPLAYLGLENWLEAYAYRIELTPWMLVIPILSIVLIACAIIGSQVLSATMKNPVDSLRYE